MKFEGIFTPIITPYDDKGSINFDTIEVIIEDLISSGVHGLVIAGKTVEYYAQDFDERMQLLSFC